MILVDKERHSSRDFACNSEQNTILCERIFGCEAEPLPAAQAEQEKVFENLAH
jgi:hypothetical protein